MPPSLPPPDFLAILEVLSRHKVEYVLVGGVAAVLYGSPANTFDVDVVHSRGTSNIERLLAALEELDAVYRMQPERRLRPGATHLTSGGHSLLLTRFGPLDVLGTIGKSRSYEDLINRTSRVEISDGLAIAVLDLPTQIEVKEEVAGPKDQLQLPILRQLLEQLKNRA